MLDINKLENSLQDIAEKPPISCEEVSKKWADALCLFFENLYPASLTVKQASQNLENELCEAIKNYTIDGNASVEIEKAFSKFAIDISTGIDKITYVSIPPPIPVDFESLFCSCCETCEEGALKFASAIDRWAKTGSSTVVLTNTIINWS